MARAVARLGLKKAGVVHSRDGLDELSPADISDLIIVENGDCTLMTVDPKSLSVHAPLNELAGGDADYNLNLLNKMLEGGGENAISKTVALNCGCLLWIAGRAKSLKEGVELSREAIASGRAGKWFNNWLQEVNEIK